MAVEADALIGGNKDDAWNNSTGEEGPGQPSGNLVLGLPGFDGVRGLLDGHASHASKVPVALHFRRGQLGPQRIQVRLKIGAPGHVSVRRPVRAFDALAQAFLKAEIPPARLMHGKAKRLNFLVPHPGGFDVVRNDKGV